MGAKQRVSLEIADLFILSEPRSEKLYLSVVLVEILSNMNGPKYVSC